MGSVLVERRGATDDEDLFRLYGEVFGVPLSESSRRRWRWQYLDNPVNRDGTEIWVAREGERLLGQYASMPVRLWWGGSEIDASWGMDVFVSAEARGRGVGALLFTTWGESVDVALGLGLTSSSYGLFRKLRYEDVGPVPFFRKVLNPAAVLRRRLGRVGSVAAPMLRLALAIVAPERETRGAEAVQVVRARRFSPEYDALWEKARGSHAMCVRRDAAYLNWKYVACPHREYDVHEARREGVVVGFAVSRHEDYRGLRLGWIVDLFTDASDAAAQDALLAAVLGDFRAAGVARTQCFAMSRSLVGALRRRGFLRGTSPMQFCVRSRVGREAFADTGGWHVTFGDSDMDR